MLSCVIPVYICLLSDALQLGRSECRSSSSPCVIRLVYVVFPFRNHWRVCVLCWFGGLLDLLRLGEFLS
jgi:hypothetical protein